MAPIHIAPMDIESNPLIQPPIPNANINNVIQVNEIQRYQLTNSEQTSITIVRMVNLVFQILSLGFIFIPGIILYKAFYDRNVNAILGTDPNLKGIKLTCSLFLVSGAILFPATRYYCNKWEMQIAPRYTKNTCEKIFFG